MRPHRTGTLIATFGEGSGTETGGTDEMFAQGRDHDAPLEMWMDTWSPVVHHLFLLELERVENLGLDAPTRSQSGNTPLQQRHNVLLH